MRRTLLLFAVFAGLCSTSAFAQYKVTEKDLGNDCVTEDGKLGTYKQVTITESVGNTSSRGNSSSTSQSGNVGVSGEYKKAGVSVGASASYGNSSSNSSSNTSSQSTTTTRTYQDVQCVEDKNANAPQMTPVRW